MTAVYALIAGGGTAGHVLPGVSIAEELARRGHDRETIHFVGAERGVEATLVPAAGFPLTLLPGRGIQRRMTVENVGSVLGLLRAFVAAAKLVWATRPRVVVALGGYASVPAAAWAVVRRTPIVVAEQNAVPGLANRLIGRFARACAVSFEGTDLPKAVWTGNPVRAEVLAVAAASPGDVAAARARLGVDPDRVLIAVFGGSLGARRINTAVLGALETLADRGDLAIRHIVGSRDHGLVSDAVSGLDTGELAYQSIEYEDDMASVFAAADLVVCRAGATSCAELAVTGTPSVLVPLPGAPGDHQTANARALERCGGAELVPDHLFDADRFVAVVDRLTGDRERLRSMAESVRRIARPDAADAVAELVERHAGAT